MNKTFLIICFILMIFTLCEYEFITMFESMYLIFIFGVLLTLEEISGTLWKMKEDRK